MRVIFRVDASPTMGTGHLNRCLTLAEAILQREPSEITFCYSKRNCKYVAPFERSNIAFQSIDIPLMNNALDHGWEHQSASRGIQQADARLVRSCLHGGGPDLVIVDHYLLDRHWEKEWPDAQVLVIDDLANRQHECEILLDQTYACSPARYNRLVSSDTIKLLGTHYALLRPEFAELRSQALAKRKATSAISNYLINFGGSDVGGLTLPVLSALLERGGDSRVSVICGSGARDIGMIESLAHASDRASLLVDCASMAEQLLMADLAFGAGGATAWERCCLGLPTITIPTAANQTEIMRVLGDADAIVPAANPAQAVVFAQQLAANQNRWQTISSHAAMICDGLGASRVVDNIFGLLKLD